jgi:hypothetical protein
MNKKKVAGYIAYYGLQDWWFSEFSEDEREYLTKRYMSHGGEPRVLTEGSISFTDQPVTSFLNALATWFRSPSDKSIFRRIHKKIDDLGRTKPIEKPGYYQGRHVSTYPTDVDDLIRAGETDKAEDLLLQLVDATEEENRKNKYGVAPWYYEKLAILYRKQKDYGKEVEMLERFAQQKHAPGASPPKLLERLEKARILRDKEK